MELSTPKFKAVAVTAGFSLWFIVITSALGVFSVVIFGIFVVLTFTILQIFSLKLSGLLDLFAIFNTKLFLGIVFVTAVSLYGIFFRILKIDLFRLKRQKNSYWLEIDQSPPRRIYKQY